MGRHGRRPVLLCLLLVSAFAPVVAAQSPPVRSDQDILIQMERDWDAALRRNDVKFIDSILADEFIVTYDDGARGDRTTELAFAATFNPKGESSRLDEFIVKEFGSTAIVWFTLHLTGPVNGQMVEVALRYADVYVLRDAKWKCVSSQSTRVATPQRGIAAAGIGLDPGRSPA
jgi:ketosteroid isomerase-like protein